MMEGIEVLAIVPEGINLVANWPVAIIFGAIVWFIFAIWLANETESVIEGIFLGLMVATMIFLITAGLSAKPTEFINTYKVIISDDIKLNEFYERYEITNQEGKIYTIKERIDETDNH